MHEQNKLWLKRTQAGSSREASARGGYRCAEVKQHKRLMKQMREMKVEQIRAAAAAVALAPTKFLNPATKMEEETNNFTALIWKVFQMAMNGHLKAVDTFFKLMFYMDPMDGGPTINIDNKFEWTKGLKVDSLETLRQLRTALRTPQIIDSCGVLNEEDQKYLEAHPITEQYARKHRDQEIKKRAAEERAREEEEKRKRAEAQLQAAGEDAPGPEDAALAAGDEEPF